jgi:hypothetical protein
MQFLRPGHRDPSPRVLSFPRTGECKGARLPGDFAWGAGSWAGDGDEASPAQSSFHGHQPVFRRRPGAAKSMIRLWPGVLFPLMMAAVAMSGSIPAAADLNSAEPLLLQQCDAMLSHTAEITGRIACEDAIASALRAIEETERGDPSLKPAYCAPNEVSATEGAVLYAEYVNTHPETVRLPAERALVLALQAAYPCPD